LRLRRRHVLRLLRKNRLRRAITPIPAAGWIIQREPMRKSCEVMSFYRRGTGRLAYWSIPCGHCGFCGPKCQQRHARAKTQVLSAETVKKPLVNGGVFPPQPRP
jgi:hypothetical protein